MATIIALYPSHFQMELIKVKGIHTDFIAMLTTKTPIQLKLSAFALFLFAILTSSVLYGQQGPGGVSVETAAFLPFYDPPINNKPVCRPDTTSTCGMWLDASTLNLADGDPVISWTDVSLSYDCDDATLSSGANAPVYRNDPAFTINALPTISFDDNQFFILSSSNDLNTDNITLEKVVFFAFRSSEDVISEQVLYEEGGGWRGFNIIIQDGKLIIGTYDKIVDNVPGPNTPAFGYSYISTTIEPNETVILTAEFHVSSTGSVAKDNDHYLKGWKNGQLFGGPGDLTPGEFATSGFNAAGLMGSLHNHPDPCGLGAVNSGGVTKNGVLSNNTGQKPFTGKLAEVCYYKDAITETQRIIVQNYLAAKYLAPIATDDWYIHEFKYGKDVIGIGVQQGSDAHNLSRGRNPFVISANSAQPNNVRRYFLTGHNGFDNVWTNNGVPKNSNNIQRLERIWRADKRSFAGNITMQLDTNKLPTSPPGYNNTNAKMVMLIDATSPNIPDFSLESTQVREMTAIPGNPYDYTFNYNFPDNAFYTFAWLKPEVGFVEDQDIALESNPGANYFTKLVTVKLNYLPANNLDATADGYTLDYTFLAGTASLGRYEATATPPLGDPDYYYNSNDLGETSGQISFAETEYIRNIPVRIMNDVDPENPPTENFTVSLTATGQVGGAIPLLYGGANSNLPFTIYDDDADPKISFVAFLDTLSQSESLPNITVELIRSGNSSTVVTCQVEVISGGTTARATALGLDPNDYNNAFTSLTVSFPAGVQTIQSFNIPISNDDVDEYDELIQLRITNISGEVAIETAESIVKNLRIEDNDLSIASFGALAQSGYETIGAPSLLVVLDPISSRDVVVDFNMITGSALYTTDYGGAQDGFVVFPPFTEDAFIGPFYVYQDGLDEGPETVLFELDSIAPLGEDKTGMTDDLTYTILDYEPFEWKGVGGVGKSLDNIVWIDASQEPLGDLTNLDNKAPYGLNIIRRGNDPANNRANRIGGMNALNFNGSTNTNNADAYEIQNSSKINIAGTVDRLSYFMVFKADIVPSGIAAPGTSPTGTQARLLYEQGGGTRGTSIYLYNDSLYFHAWNDADDDDPDNNPATPDFVGDQAPWGNGNFVPDQTYSVFAKSSQAILAGTEYVISCHYDNNNVADPLQIYVNGVKGTMSPIDLGDNIWGVGRLWGHAGRIGLGSVRDNTRFHFSTNQSADRRCGFDGEIAEFITFHEPEMSEARRVIIENYLSGKYDIALDNLDTPQAWDISDPLRADFRNDIAGLGQEALAASGHTTSQGPYSVCKVSSPLFDGNKEGYLMWGSNSEELTNTWPWTDASNNFSLPLGINERAGQVWKFDKWGDITSVRISIDFNSSDNSGPLSLSSSYLKLMVHSNADPQDFSTAEVYNLSNPATGAVAVFSNVLIRDPMYVTLGNTQDYFTTPLPIELLSFDARLNGDKVNINWATSTETNNEYFEIERADDNFNWDKLYTVPGAGNSTTEINYAKVDFNPLKGISYYRLKQVDFDGAYTYSDPVSVLYKQTSTEDFYIFPNPTQNQEISLYIPAQIESIATITVYDLTGKVKLQKQINSEQRIERLNLGDLPQGLYLVQLKSDQYNSTKKLVVE